MKQLNKILLILSLALCLSGGVLLAVGAFAGGINDAQEIAGTRTRTYNQEKTRLDAFTAIEADLSLSDLEVRPSGDDHAYLEYHIDAPVNSTPLEATVKNNVLTLRDWVDTNNTGISQVVGNVLGWLPYGEHRTLDESSIILYLPQSVLERCDIDMDLGELSIDGLNANAVDLSLSVGNLSLANCTFASSDIDLDLGDITADNMTLTGENSMSLSTGDLTLGLTNPDALNINADVDLGSINVTDRYLGGFSSDDGDSGSHFNQTRDNTSGSLTLYADLGDITLK